MIAIGSLEQRAHVVLGGENRRDQFLRGRHIALADAVEGGLAMMGEGGERIEAEHRTRTLERVQAAEHRVDLRPVGEVARQVEKPQLDLFEQLGGFGSED